MANQKPTKLEIARARNMLKMRITGLIFLGTPGESTTPFEKQELQKIAAIKEGMLNHWDEGSVLLGMTVKPKKDRFKT